MSFFKSKKLFFIALLLYVISYGYNNIGAGIDDLSSDLLIYQMVMVQEEYASWDYLPNAYNREDLYIAYPLLYALNPGLEHSFYSYHLLTILIIAATYLISGYVLWRITGHWGLATLGALLILIPHNVGFTTTGISSIGDLRGNTLAFPFYLLLGYYWLIDGIHSKRSNIFLSVIAGLLIYVYPIASFISVFVFSCAGLMLYRGTLIRSFLMFWATYLIVVSPFLFVHFTNPNAQMVSSKESLNSVDPALYVEIIKYRFEGNAFLSTVDIARVKRTIWDSVPLVTILLFGVVFLHRKKYLFTPNEWLAHKISLISLTVLVAFVVGIDAINQWKMSRDELPVFLEHIRAMRIMGFILIAEAMLVLSVVLRNFKQPVLIGAVSLVLLFAPIHFSAPAIREMVRAVVPVSLRLKYNLAPVVGPGQGSSVQSVVDTGYWGRENLPRDARVFVLSVEQHDFIFKFISRRNTNLTSKEGSIWVTSGEDNAVRWFTERKQYEQKVLTRDPLELINFARSLEATHLLVFKGEWHEVFEDYLSNVVYENTDYYVIEL